MSSTTSSITTNFSGDNSGSNGGVALFFTVLVLALILVGILIRCSVPKFLNQLENCCKPSIRQTPDTKFMTLTVDKFLNDIEREKIIRFSDQQLRIATENYSRLLGSGGFGKVYKGSLSNGTMIAVKVLRESSGKRIDEQFMAEVGALGKVHHFNLVHLHGFCFEGDLRALVFEYMVNGALEKYLFCESVTLSFEKLHEIAVGTARGIAYMHEECQQRIIHYDIKPGNVLLDRNFNPKVADFGLAKLCNREITHLTLTKGRGTPGYAAPELWMPNFPVTHKCDVYSFGMLLFEIIGRRRNLDLKLVKSQEWFPMWVWKRFDAREFKELIIACGIEEKNMELTETMVNVALSCVQYRPDSRPIMSDVVKMLEGSLEIPKPLSPFQHMIDLTSTTCPVQASQTDTDTSVGSDSSAMVTKSVNVLCTPTMTKYATKLASV